MALPPPSPTRLVADISGFDVPVTKIGDHPAIPILLGQAFCPPTPGITVPLDPTAPPRFEPIYASVEDWSMAKAREKAAIHRTQANPAAPTAAHNPIDERNIMELAENMKAWAMQEHVSQVNGQLLATKEKALILASQAAARVDIKERALKVAELVTEGQGGQYSPEELSAARAILEGGLLGEMAVKQAMGGMNLTPFAIIYRSHLDALASGYFSQLHREALNRLMTAVESPSSVAMGTASSTGIFPTSQAPSQGFNAAMHGTVHAKALNIQSAAAAALAANNLAANELAGVASIDLLRMGVDPTTLVPRRLVGGLQSLEVSTESLAQPSSLPAPVVVPHVSTLPVEIVTMMMDIRLTPSECTPAKCDYLLAYAHTLYAREPKNADLLPFLLTLHTIHPDHLPTLLLMSCVYYSRGQLQESYMYNQKLLEYDPTYVRSASVNFLVARTDGMLGYSSVSP